MAILQEHLVVRFLLPVLILFTVLFLLIELKPCNVGAWDFSQYWSASKLSLAGQNPYDAKAILKIEQNVVCDRSFQLPVLFWNPPITLLLVWPLSYFEFDTASAIWFFLSILVLLASVFLCTASFRALGAANLSPSCFLILLTCPAVFLVLWWGQLSAWLLLGLVLFLYATVGRGLRSTDSLLGGLALALTLFKPHLLFLIYLYLTVQSFFTYKFRTLIGLALAAVGSLLLAYLIQPKIISWYLESLSLAPPLYWRTASLGSYLQAAFPNLEAWIMRSLPLMLISLLLLPKLFQSMTKAMELHLVLILVPLSLVCSPYGWAFDQVLLLPVIIYSLLLKSRAGLAAVLLVLANLYGLLSLNLATQDIFLCYSAVVLLVVTFVGQPKIEFSQQKD